METQEKWISIIESAGFKRQFGISGDWSFVTSKIANSPWRWYVKDDSVIGLSIDRSNLVKLLFIHNPTSNRPAVVARKIRPKDHIDASCVVDALSNPEQSPLCIGIPWAVEIAESTLLKA